MAKWVMRKEGRKVAKESWSNTAKMAVARREVARVVYGSERMGRLRRGREWEWERGRRRR